jgi:hypothetical protein
MTTTNTSANLYPFLTKSQIKERLESDREFRMQAMVILYTLQTEYEQNTDQTLNKNRQGFMSSHAVNGSRVARKIKGGEPLDAKDEAHVDAIAPRYSRQLAVFFRAKAIAEQPALKAVAALFSAAPKAEAVAPEADADEAVVAEVIG